MKILLFIATIIFCSGYGRAQTEIEVKLDVCSHNALNVYKESFVYSRAETGDLTDEGTEQLKKIDEFAIEPEWKKSPVNFTGSKRFFNEKAVDETDAEDTQEAQVSARNNGKEKFHWKPAFVQSGVSLGFQHGYRLATQKGTREQLKGRFFSEWAQSVKNLRGWDDGNKFYINYVGHPLQGGVTGRIFVANSDRAKSAEFGKSKKYWESRLKAMAWSAVWSAQFELGPVSEANIGNVGLQRRENYSSMAYVDLVVTPVLGTAVLVGEDAIDKYILRNRLERNASRTTFKIRVLRSVLTPTMTVSNLLRGRVPWKRDDRSL